MEVGIRSDIKATYAKGSLWDLPLIIYEFEHFAGSKSRSGDFTVSLILAPPTNFDNEPNVSIVLAGHECTNTITRDMLLDEIHLLKQQEKEDACEYTTETLKNMISIYRITRDLVNKYKKQEYVGLK